MSFNGLPMNTFNGLIDGMNKSELEELFKNDEKIRKMVLNDPEIKRLRAEKKRLWQSNRKRAIENLNLEPQMEKTKTELISAHIDYDEAVKAYNDCKDKLDKLRDSFSAQTILALMKVANAEEDEKSERLQKRFIAKKIELEEYLPQMLEHRKSYNLRRIKIEKLSELASSSGGNRQYPTTFSSPSPHSSSSRHQAPYPVIKVDFP